MKHTCIAIFYKVTVVLKSHHVTMLQNSPSYNLSSFFCSNNHDQCCITFREITSREGNNSGLKYHENPRVSFSRILPGINQISVGMSLSTRGGNITRGKRGEGSISGLQLGLSKNFRRFCLVNLGQQVTDRRALLLLFSRVSRPAICIRR